MDELISSLETTVQNAGGSILWDDLLNTVDFKDRAQVPNALKLAKSQSRLKRRVEVVDGKSRLYVEKFA